LEILSACAEIIIGERPVGHKNPLLAFHSPFSWPFLAPNPLCKGSSAGQENLVAVREETEWKAGSHKRAQSITDSSTIKSPGRGPSSQDDSIWGLQIIPKSDCFYPHFSPL